MAIRIKDLSEVTTLTGNEFLIVDDSSYTSAKGVKVSTIAAQAASTLASNSEGVLATVPSGGGLKLVPHGTDESANARFYQHTANPTGADVLKFGGVLQATELLSMLSVSVPGAKLFYDGTYGCAGLAFQLTNRTGALSVRGKIVAPASTEDGAVIYSKDYKAIGVILESGVADGSPVWVQVAGIAMVLMEDDIISVSRGDMLKATTGGFGTVNPYGDPLTAEQVALTVAVALQHVTSTSGTLLKCMLKL